MEQTKGFILVHNEYGWRKVFCEKKEEIEFALKVFGSDWHIEETVEPKFEYKNCAGLSMGYTC